MTGGLWLWLMISEAEKKELKDGWIDNPNVEIFLAEPHLQCVTYVGVII